MRLYMEGRTVDTGQPRHFSRAPMTSGLPQLRKFSAPAGTSQRRHRRRYVYCRALLIAERKRLRMLTLLPAAK